MTGSMRRREFLFEFLCGLAAVPVLAALPGCSRRESLRVALLDFFADRDSARAVGAAYLESAPEEDDDERLLRGLTGGRVREAEWEALATSDPAALYEQVRELHRSDFAAGRTLQLSGWVLSETELRLCALLAQMG